MRALVALVTLAVGALLALAPADAAQAMGEASRHTTLHAATTHGVTHKVPVAAVFTYHPHQDSSEGVIHGAINAVVRIPGGTAVFYSLGGRADSVAGNMPPLDLVSPYNAFDAWSVGIIDPQGMKYYQPLTSADEHCLCSKTADIGGLSGPAKPLVGYAVLPELPARMKTATVVFGYGVVLPGIPITDTLPRPTTKASGNIELGGGWPALPSKSAIAATDKSLSILPMAANTAKPQAATSSTPTTTSIALNSSVLFDFGKATLTPAANGVLEDAAAKISKAGTGVVTIVGYTDSIGDDADNQVLSEQRAQAVQAALTKLVTRRGVTFQASGKGEQEPVADNGTDAGRALNRRVTVTFTKAGQ